MNTIMRYFGKRFLLFDALFIIILGLGIKSAWPSLDVYSRYAAIGILLFAAAFALVALAWFADQAIQSGKQKRYELQCYKMGQTQPPYRQQVSTEISEDDTEIPLLPQETKHFFRPKAIKKLPQGRNLRNRNPFGNDERNSFGNAPKLISEPFQQSFLKQQKTVISDGKKMQAIQQEIPKEIESEIIRLHSQGLKNTEIRDRLRISGEGYWMIKTIVDSLNS